jgi:hypothetical protein
LPDGLSGDLPVQRLLQKDSGFRRTQIKSTSQPSRPHKRGVSRSSRTLGTGCGGRGSVRRAAARGRVMLISRTVKSCGPDAPTLASSFRRIICAGDGGKKARSPGRARSKPLKPLRREGRVKPVDLAATTLVCHQHFAHEAAGAAGTRLSLRPLFFEAKDLAQLGRIAPRDRGRVSYAKARLCENGATKQSILFFARRDGLLRGACHRARIRATRWLATTVRAVPVGPRLLSLGGGGSMGELGQPA